MELVIPKNVTHVPVCSHYISLRAMAKLRFKHYLWITFRTALLHGKCYYRHLYAISKRHTSFIYHVWDWNIRYYFVRFYGVSEVYNIKYWQQPTISVYPPITRPHISVFGCKPVKNMSLHLPIQSNTLHMTCTLPQMTPLQYLFLFCVPPRHVLVHVVHTPQWSDSLESETKSL